MYENTNDREEKQKEKDYFVRRAARVWLFNSLIVVISRVVELSMEGYDRFFGWSGPRVSKGVSKVAFSNADESAVIRFDRHEDFLSIHSEKSIW